MERDDLHQLLDRAIFIITALYSITCDQEFSKVLIKDIRSSREAKIREQYLQFIVASYFARRVWKVLMIFDKNWNIATSVIMQYLIRLIFRTTLKKHLSKIIAEGIRLSKEMALLLLIIKRSNPRIMYDQKKQLLMFILDKHINYEQA